jgi:hypothetical protein
MHLATSEAPVAVEQAKKVKKEKKKKLFLY